MDDFKELFDLFASMYDGITHKKLKYDDFMGIFPKLKVVRKHIPVGGIELVLLIDELIEIKERNLLDRINDETMDLVKRIYYGQLFIGNTGILSTVDIIKHLLLPYNLNICKEERDTYFHISGFEFMFSFLAAIIGKKNFWQQEIIRKYNNGFYELLMHYYLYDDKIVSIENTQLASAVLNMFGIFYFKQDEYANDYSFLDECVENAIANRKDFIDYCNQEGIKEAFTCPDDYKNTYAGIIKYIDESYKLRNNKGK